jgi:branched-chain amino acid transport system substrate-binding protein
MTGRRSVRVIGAATESGGCREAVAVSEAVGRPFTPSRGAAGAGVDFRGVADEMSSDAGAGEAVGVRTFLIADLRGYTRYSDEHGDEAASALARAFAAIANDAVGAHGGEVIELRGDEALCVFASARSAVRGAVELQRRARVRAEGEPALPLGVGIGIDAGEAVATAGGYRGRALNVASRLCSLAKGGEILASETVAHLAGRHDEADYAPRKPTTVKGVAEPIRFVEVLPTVELPPPPAPAPPLKHRPAGRATVLLIGACVLLAAVAAVAAVKLSEGGNAKPAGFQTIASGRCGPLRYKGAGSPQFLIVGDLPLQQGILETTTPMANAMTLALERRGYRAGPYRVGLQVCDDATPRNLGFDERVCSANAHEYVKDPSVIAVAGPFSSGCAAREIPILNGAPGGPLAIVSPSSTYVGLTRKPTRGSHEPAVYFPTQRRNFARVIPADDVQAAADAIVARRLGVKRVYAVDQGDVPSKSFATYFLRAARRLGIAVAGGGSWDPKAGSYKPLASVIARTDADGVFLAVPSYPESVRLLTEFRTRLGRGVQFMAPDAFDPATAALAGAAAEGMTISEPGPADDDLGRDGERFAASFSKRFGGKPTRFAVEAAQAIDILLDAIALSDGSRSSVTTNLFKTQVSNGILGSFGITSTGDTTLNVVAIYRITGGKVKTFTNVVVPDALLAPN